MNQLANITKNHWKETVYKTLHLKTTTRNTLIIISFIIDFARSTTTQANKKQINEREQALWQVLNDQLIMIM